MVGFGQSAGGAGGAGITTATLRDLAPHGASILDRHRLMLVTKGHGTHEVDFEVYQCRPGTLVWARPGQLVRPGGQPGLDATLLCWTPGPWPAAPDPGSVDGAAGGGAVTVPELPDGGPTHRQLAGEDEDAVINEVSQLVVDCERGLSPELLRQQLATLLLRVRLLGPQSTQAPPPVAGAQPPEGLWPAGEVEAFDRFRDELERGYARTRRVEDYADRLGCCVRTLTRASLAATGRSAKQVIDDRVTLEAKRLLAGTDLPVAEIGRRLGFPEPTNFGRFFQREAGQSPGAFRAEAAGGEAPGPPATEAVAGGWAGVPAPRPPLDPVTGYVQA
ncbi:AraC family transcriptional regulator [Phytohabitans sp. ZYX-F-186]|uniref:AraC family transcriptional regulator n=1 Tax=Phytohabitans maris TaxID=3071409 RepID=A0ABU0ZHY2_9ACTN|nr:AraC family transcriptional regulator [Phytohabitans sp. ZYX-F-186]MDQ7906039.1 AraC family transcriptional regulator [Phytohabitans sp. ZYX-F-186]